MKFFIQLFLFLALSACVVSCQAGSLEVIHWASFENMWYFLLAVIVAGLLSVRYTKKQKVQELLVGTHVEFLRNYSAKKQVFKSILFCIGFLFLCVALLRPQWNKSEETVAQEGRDLYVALDISRSMLATDYQTKQTSMCKRKN